MAPKVRLPLVVRLPMDRPPSLVDRLPAPLETFRFGGGAREFTDWAEALPYA